MTKLVPFLNYKILLSNRFPLILRLTSYVWCYHKLKSAHNLRAESSPIISSCTLATIFSDAHEVPYFGLSIGALSRSVLVYLWFACC